MNTSVFLAKLIGPMFLILGLFTAIRREQMVHIARDFLNSEALIFLSGILTLPIGLAIVITHNVWAADWRVLITLVGWISIVAGIARITLPGLMKSVGETMLEKTALITVPGALMALLGAYLSYCGYPA